MSFNKKLEMILAESKKRNLKEDQENSPTRVHSEKGEVVTANFGDKGGQTVDATGPIPTNAAATLKTNPGNTTGGPTGHIPDNKDLPRPQLGGLDKDNKNPGKAPDAKPSYTFEEKDEDEKKDDMKEEDEKKLPPFMAKKKDEDKDDKKDVKDVKEGEEKDEDKDKQVAEEADDKDDKKAVEEAVASLLQGEQLSEAFKLKTSTLFEATLSNRIKAYRKKLNERYEATLNKRVEQIREEISSKVDGHLDLVVEAWAKDNEVGIDNGIKSALVEDFIGGLKALFEESYIELPEDKVNVVDQLASRITTLETKLSEQIEINVGLQKTNKLHEKTEILARVSKGLTATQAEKLKTLAEGTDFKSSKQFEQSVGILKESVVGTQKADPKANTNGGKKQDLAEQTLNQNPDSDMSSKQITSVKETLSRMARN